VKRLIVKLTISLIIWVITYLIIAWLVEGSFWLHFFLASALSASTNYTGFKERLKRQEDLFDISDGQVVFLSNKTDEHEKEIDELKDRISELEDKVANLEKYE